MGEKITKVTSLPQRGQTSIHVVPAKPCGLGDCIGELFVQIGVDSMRLHLGEEQRAGLIEALGGVPRDEATVMYAGNEAHAEAIREALLPEVVEVACTCPGSGPWKDPNCLACKSASGRAFHTPPKGRSDG